MVSVPKQDVSGMLIQQRGVPARWPVDIHHFAVHSVVEKECRRMVVVKGRERVRVGEAALML